MRNLLGVCTACTLYTLFDIDFHHELEGMKILYSQTAGRTLEAGYANG